MLALSHASCTGPQMHDAYTSPYAQDGTEVKRSERIQAEQRLPELEAQLRQQLIKEGIDPDTAAQVCLKGQCVS